MENDDDTILIKSHDELLAYFDEVMTIQDIIDVIEEKTGHVIVFEPED